MNGKFQDWIDRFMLLLFIVSLIVMLWIVLGTSDGAPAPLSKRDRNSSHYIPHTCIMHWGDCKYHATFSPCGKYKAVRVDSPNDIWTGIWHITRDLNGDTLVIKESHGDVLTDNTFLYNVKMCKCLKVSENRRVRLEPTK